MNIKHLVKSAHHYIPLIGMLAAGIIGFSMFSFDKNFQAAIGVAMAAGYVTWGVTHHHISRDLYFEVLLEYVAVAVLGLVIIFSIIFRS